MPWTVADVEKHKRGLTEPQKRQWVAIANRVLADCLKEGGTDETCAPKAIRQANGSVGGKMADSVDATMTEDDLLVAFGGTVKAAGEGRVEGFLVRFTSKDELDLEGDFFDGSTDYDFVNGERSAVYYHHGSDKTLKRRKLADGALELRDEGVWVAAQLDLRDRYERMIYGMAEDGKLGWSSGTAPHLVEREPEGKGHHITKWPLRLDASLTPSPADPGNRVMTYKAYAESLDPNQKVDLSEFESEKDSKTSTGEGEAIESSKKPQPKQSKAVKGATMVGNRKELFHIGDHWMAYALDEEGNRTGDPLKAFSEEEEGRTWVQEQNAPGEVRLAREVGASVAKAVADILQPMIADMRTEPQGLVVDPSKSYAQPKKAAGKYTFGDFLWAVTTKDTKMLEEMGSEYKEFKVLGDQTGAAGGHLVPTVFIPDLITFDPETEVVYPRADRIPTTGPIAIPGLTTTGAGAGRSNFLGGMWAGWTERGESKPEQEPEFTMIEMVPHELSGYTEVKETLINRSRISLDPLLRGLFQTTIRYVRDEAFLDGVGAGQPWGIINSPGTYVQARQTAGTITYRDLVRMKNHLLPACWGKAHWVFNISCYEALCTIQDDNGNFIWREDAIAGEARTVMGLPYMMTEKTPTLGESGDVVLADERYYYVAEEGSIAIATSEHFRFRSNRIAYKFVLYVDGQEKLAAPIVLKDGSFEVSPFVILGEGAS